MSSDNPRRQEYNSELESETETRLTAALGQLGSGFTSGEQFMNNAPLCLSQKAHRQLIGVLGLCLPLLVYVLAGFRPVPTIPRWTRLESVRAYYYTGSVAAFVGVIFSLSLFLFTYPGYKNVMADRVIGTIGGLVALGVVLFPTAAPADQLRLSWWRCWMGAVHYTSAVSLFVCFILFSLWLFRKSDLPVRQQSREKRVRNYVYLGCGIVMIISLTWAGLAGLESRPIFLPEGFAIEAFAVSWLVKGEAEHTVKQVAYRLRAVTARSPISGKSPLP